MQNMCMICYLYIKRKENKNMYSYLLKESVCNAEDLSLIPRLGRSPGEGNGNPLQYFCLENLMDRGAWQAPKLDTT